MWKLVFIQQLRRRNLVLFINSKRRNDGRFYSSRIRPSSEAWEI